MPLQLSQKEDFIIRQKDVERETAPTLAEALIIARGLAEANRLDVEIVRRVRLRELVKLINVTVTITEENK